MSEKAEQEFLSVDSIVRLPFTESAGRYLTKFFTKIRDEGKLMANKCPSCQRVIFPPRVMCAFCKTTIEDRPENWVELSDKGTVVDIQTIEEREVDAVTGETIGSPNPNAFIRPDGGDQWTILGHILEEMDPEKLLTGMRVEAVWKPREERLGRMSDILYFRTIEEGEG